MRVGMGHVLGSIEVGKFADLVLWDPAFFGTKPELVLKGGNIAFAMMGAANASVPTTEPILMRRMYGGFPKAAASSSFAFVSQVFLFSAEELLAPDSAHR